MQQDNHGRSKRKSSRAREIKNRRDDDSSSRAETSASEDYQERRGSKSNKRNSTTSRSKSKSELVKDEDADLMQFKIDQLQARLKATEETIKENQKDHSKMVTNLKVELARKDARLQNMSPR